MIVVAVTALGGAILFSALLLPFKFEDPRWPDMVATVATGCVALLICAILLVLAGQKPASVGWRTGPLGINVAVGLGGLVVTVVSRLVLVVTAALVYRPILEEATQAQRGIEATLPPMNVPAMAVLMTFIVIWEEVVFRGFLLTRLQAVFRRWWLTILVGSVVFGLVHGYQGWLAMAMVTLMAVIMGIVFVWRRSLLPTMVLHWIHNVGALILLQMISSTWK